MGKTIYDAAKVKRVYEDLSMPGSTLMDPDSYAEISAINPIPTDDISKGYKVGTPWFDISSRTLYMCQNNTTGLAVWTKTSDPHNLGWFADLTALQTAFPTGINGDFAILGDVDRVYVWDSDTSSWVSTSSSGLVTSVFGRTSAVVAQVGDYSFSQISGSLANTQLPAGGAWTIGAGQTLSLNATDAASRWSINIPIVMPSASVPSVVTVQAVGPENMLLPVANLPVGLTPVGGTWASVTSAHRLLWNTKGAGQTEILTIEDNRVGFNESAITFYATNAGGRLMIYNFGSAQIDLNATSSSTFYSGTTSGIGIGATGSANDKLLVKGRDATSSYYCARFTDSADVNLFSVRNDGQATFSIVPLFTTGNLVVANMPLNGTWTLSGGDLTISSGRVKITGSLSNMLEVTTTTGISQINVNSDRGSARGLYLKIRPNNITTSGFINDLGGTDIKEAEACAVMNANGDNHPLYLGANNKANVCIYDGLFGVGYYNASIKPSVGFATRGIDAIFNEGNGDFDFTINKNGAGTAYVYNAGFDQHGWGRAPTFGRDHYQATGTLVEMMEVGDASIVVRRYKNTSREYGLNLSTSGLYVYDYGTGQIRTRWEATGVVHNQSQQDYDFTINKNGSGTAYVYNAGDDTHTFGGNVLAYLLGNGTNADQTLLTISNGFATNNTLDYVTTLYGTWDGLIYNHREGANGAVFGIINSSANTNACLLALSTNTTTSVNPKVAVVRDPTPNDTTDWFEAYMSISNSADGYSAVFGLKAQANDKAYLKAVRAGVSAACSNLIVNPVNEDSDFTINKNGAGTAYVYNAGDDTHTFSAKINLSQDLVLTDSSKAVYFGSETVDGSWRFIRSGNNFVMERRESSSWVTKMTVEA